VAVKRGFYVTMEAVRERWTYHVAQAHAVFRNKLENELPPLLVGLDAVDIRKEMVKVVDEITATLRRGDYPKEKDPDDSSTTNDTPRKGRAGRKVPARVA
jgi:3-deoxy-D-arabino-heptulosonate 7-phosphate (DAHP) synthase class II